MIGYRRPRRASWKVTLIVLTAVAILTILLSYGPGMIREWGWLG
jgi:hypothetical protein